MCSECRNRVRIWDFQKEKLAVWIIFIPVTVSFKLWVGSSQKSWHGSTLENLDYTNHIQVSDPSDEVFLLSSAAATFFEDERARWTVHTPIRWFFVCICLFFISSVYVLCSFVALYRRFWRLFKIHLLGTYIFYTRSNSQSRLKLHTIPFTYLLYSHAWLSTVTLKFKN